MNRVERARIEDQQRRMAELAERTKAPTPKELRMIEASRDRQWIEKDPKN